jgi:hypothetical protein
VILAVLALMILAYYRRQVRKARKRPRGSIPSTFFTDQPPEREMSQTQDRPLLISAAPFARQPVPIQFFNASPSNNTSSSLSPLLFPAATFQDTAGSYPRLLSASEYDASSHAPSDPLQSPYDMQASLSPEIPQPEKAVIARSVPPSTSDELSSLHRDMTEFQKSLETGQKEDVPSQSIIVSDPPPKYIG